MSSKKEGSVNMRCRLLRFSDAGHGLFALTALAAALVLLAAGGCNTFLDPSAPPLAGLGQQITHEQATVALTKDKWDPKDDSPGGATDLGLVTKTSSTTPLHTVGTAGDTCDWFKFALPFGHSYVILVLPSSGIVSGQLYKGANTDKTIFCGNIAGRTAGFSITYTALVGGMYYLCVNAFQTSPSQLTPANYTVKCYQLDDANQAGLYDAVIEEDPWDTFDNSDGTAPWLENSPGVETEQKHGPHSIGWNVPCGQADERDTFRVVLRLGETCYFRGQDDGKGNKPTAILFGPDSTSSISHGLAWSTIKNGWFEIKYTPQISGTYVLQVSIGGYLATRKSIYTLYYRCWSQDAWDPGDNTRLGAGVPQITSTYHGPHLFGESDREDWFRVSLSASKKYVFGSAAASGSTTTSSSDGLLYGELWRDIGGGGAQLVATSTGGGKGKAGVPFRLEYTTKPNEAGLYFVRIYTQCNWGCGAYYYLAFRSG